MITPDNYKAPISDEIATHLKNYTSSADRTKVARQYKISVSTLRDVTYSGSNITKNNIDAVNTLIEIAKKNCAEIIEKAKQCEVFFEEVKS